MATEVTASAPGDTTTTTAPHQSSSPRSPLFADDNHDNRDADLQDDAAQAASKSSPVQSPVTAPPYWSPSQSHPPRFFGDHGGGGRAVPPHNGSTESVAPINAIMMHDNETAGEDATPERVSGRDRNRACWAKSVSVTDYVIVNSSTTNIGAFVVWNIRVETLSGSYMNIRKRYSEFDDLRHKLMMTFPNFEAAVPVLPPKSVISKFRPKFLEKRRSGLQYFLNCILLNPEFSGSPVLKDFLFS
ncbi:hypothetical protein PspLS_01401 [Pyricularia sp. CBS 133598]|nr:hypothetical protein PspLS_01401 [Pyricularia sp. CBS 133598]